MKTRIQHTRYAAAAFLPALLFAGPRWPSDSLPHQGLAGLGLAFLILCVLGRTWCSLYIGGRKKQHLVDTGPFSVVRNPLYVFSFLGVLGIGLSSATVTLPILLAMLFLVYYPGVVRGEEALLQEIFGPAYADYRARVPRWLPDPGRWRNTETLEVMPQFVVATLRDSAWFLLAYPAFGLLEWLHEREVLPVLVQLP